MTFDTFIISSYDHRLRVNHGFLSALKKIKYKYNATMFLLPTSVYSEEQTEAPLPKEILSLFDYNYLFEDRSFNNNFILKPGKSHAFRKNPFSGFEGLHIDKTVVIGGLPRRMVTLPSVIGTRQVISAGSVGDLSEFIPGPGFPKTSGRNWELQKMYARPSASIVQIHLETQKVFHRYVQWDFEKEGIYDLNYFYPAGNVSPYVVSPYFLTGDVHVSEQDKQAWSATKEQILFLKPQEVIVQDVFNGSSVNHHEINKATSYTKENKPDLIDELIQTSEWIDEALTLGVPISWLHSNHCDFLVKYLDEPNNWIKDRHNVQLSYSLLSDYLNNPKIHPINNALELNKRVKWLSDKTTHMYHSTHVTHGHCVPQSYKVLTPSGFKYITEINTGDSVVGYKNGYLVDSTVEDTIKYDYTGEMIDFQGNTLRQRVTIDHHLYTVNDQYLPVVEAIKTTAYKDYDLVGIKKKINPKGINISDSFLKLLVAVQADGTYQEETREKRKGNSKIYSIRFKFRKQRKIDRLNEIITELGYSNISWDGIKNTKNFRASLPPDLVKKVLVYLPNKKFDFSFLSLSSTQRSVFLNELKYWDGNIKNDKRFRYFSSLKENLNLVAQIAIEEGYKVIFESDKVLSISTVKKKDDRTIKERGKYEKIKVENFPVACLQTSTSNFIIITDKGTVELTGNCGLNGARGFNLEKMAMILNSFAIGHLHTASIINNSMVVGTLSVFDPNYRKGVSSWSHGNGLIHPNCAVQQLPIFGGIHSVF